MAKDSQAPEMLTIRETSARFGISYKALHNFVKTGVLPSLSCGNRSYLSPVVVQDFLNKKLGITS